MPLPPALAAKLSKRGLITSKKTESAKKANYKGLSTCPNKYNIFHECNHWCETHWKGVLNPDPRYVRNMQKLLFKYPLPNNWSEVLDKGLGRYYYWNMENDLVSWLPPRHPKSIKSQSAAKLREKLILTREQETIKKDKEITERNNNNNKDKERGEKYDSSSSDDEQRGYHLSSSSSKHDRKERDRDRERERDNDRKHKKDDRYNNRKRTTRRDDNIIDPMDPASYSDIPQGTWSDGLETNRNRADNTASGTLYQQRPYPAPGEVLAINKEKGGKKK